MGLEVAYDPAKNIKIAKIVQKYPVVYNFRKYPVAIYRREADAAWRTIAAKLNVTDEYCKRRWINIKGCFRRYLINKIRRDNTKTYYLANYLTFMLPFMGLGKNFLPVAEHINTSDDNDEDDGKNDDKKEDKNGEMEIGTELEVKLVDSDGEESFIVPTSSNHSKRLTGEVGRNPDWDFFLSLLPDVRKMDPQQKSKFKNSLLTAIDTALYGEDF